jgi:tRNA1(Val) A37 N6-methylase TrmN6
MLEFSVIIIVLILLIVLLYGDVAVTFGAVVSIAITVAFNYSSNKTIDGGGGQNNFPYKKYFISKDRIPSMLENIKSQKFIKGPDELSPSPQKLELIRQKDAYDEADVIGDLFTEEARMCARVDRNISPIRFWKTREPYIRLEAKKRFPLKYNEHDVDSTGKNAFALRETIYQLTKEANQFSPSAAAAVYKLVSKKLRRKIDILDPFAGWGDRGLAAVALIDDSVNSYTGIDANSSLRDGYARIQEQEKQETKEKVKFHIADSLTYLRKHESELKGKFDLIFTSPPYYNYETYSEDKEQSINGKSSYHDWLESFYKPILILLTKFLKPGGIFIIHVGPTYSAPTFDVDTKTILNKTNLKFYNTIHFNGGRSIPAFIYTNTDKSGGWGSKMNGANRGCRIFC